MEKILYCDCLQEGIQDEFCYFQGRLVFLFFFFLFTNTSIAYRVTVISAVSVWCWEYKKVL